MKTAAWWWELRSTFHMTHYANLAQNTLSAHYETAKKDPLGKLFNADVDNLNTPIFF